MLLAEDYDLVFLLVFAEQVSGAGALGQFFPYHSFILSLEPSELNVLVPFCR